MDSMEWNIICRICLQEGEMRSIFENDDDDNIKICDKIMHCSKIKIHRGENLPENICDKCYENLKISYTFRINCESSDAILQSFLSSNIINQIVIAKKNEDHKYVGSKDLVIKRIKSSQNKIQSSHEKQKDYYDDNSQHTVKTEISNEHEETQYSHFVDSENEMKLSEKEYVDIQDNSTYDNSLEDDYVVLIRGDYENSANSDLSHDVIELSEKLPEPQIVENETEKINNEDDNKIRTKGKKTKQLSNKKRKEPKLHTCDLCGNFYKQKHSLDTHLRRHRNEKPFSCEICGRAFVLNVELKCHMRTHTGQKPYGCRFCDRHFSDFGSRIKHERMHTGERPYVCGTCGKAFAYSYGLSSHMLTHTGEKPFECPKCGRRFTKKHHLKSHLNTHNKQELRSKIIHVKVEETDIQKEILNNDDVDSEDYHLNNFDDKNEYIDVYYLTDGEGVK